MPDFSRSAKWVAKVESGIEDMHNSASGGNMAADLRSIGNMYDKLVLKMFNQRSHLRGDIMLLKKDAQLLRNEMKFLIVKHDGTTAFKKGYGSEDHEKERILKAELVTKEMGQLELALAELISKYYYLLQQTKTLKEINSLWHIKSVLNFDVLQFNSLKPGSSDGGIDVALTPEKKDSKELRDESSKLIEKVRWLTKLSHEFRKELQELGSAKMALLTGRSCLENEYCKVGNVEPIQDSIPRALDVNSISTDIRNAEIRIIDSLHERIEALDKLTDAFKDLMLKVSFGMPNNAEGDEAAVKQTGHDKSQSLLAQKGSIVDEESNTLAGKESIYDANHDSENEPEEIQVRFIREDVIEDTDFRCLQPEVALHSAGNREKDNFVHHGERDHVNQYDSIQGQMDVQDNSSCETIQGPHDHESINTIDLKSAEDQRPSNEKIVDSKKTYTSAVLVWLQPEECEIAENESDETLTGDAESNEEDEETQFCKLIEKEFEDTEDDRRKSLRKKRDSKYCLDVINSKSERSKKLEKNTTDRFTKELTSLLNMDSKEDSSTTAEETVSKSSFEVTDCEDRHERFHLAKSFFEPKLGKKESDAMDESRSNASIERPVDKGIEIPSNENHETEVKSRPNDIEKNEEEEEKNEEKNEENKDSEESLYLTRDVSSSSMLKGRTMTREDRPIFYNPSGSWKLSSAPNTRFQRSKSTLSASTSSEGNKKSLSNNMVSQGSPKAKQADSLKTATPSGCKTLPRGFKSRKSQERDNPLKATGNVTPRRPPREPFDQYCSTLPKKLKNSPRQARPGSGIPRMSPDFTANKSNRKEPSQTAKEGQNDARRSSQNKASTRPNSQVISRGLSTEGRSNLTKVDSEKRVWNGTQRPLSRIGSLKQETNDGRMDMSPSKPVNRGSIYRPVSRCDNTRPSSRNDSLVRRGVSIYGTLPRSRKRIIEQKEKHINDNEAKPVTSNVHRKSSEQSSTSTFSDESFEMIHVREISSQSEKFAINQEDVEGNLDENRNTDRNSCFEDTKNNTMKRQKVLDFNANHRKNSSNIDDQNRKDTKQERKTKKTVSEKAASFVQNAFRRISPDSKTNTKNNAKNTSHSENVVKRRSQSLGSRNENRKSFIPVPTLS